MRKKKEKLTERSYTVLCGSYPLFGRVCHMQSCLFQSCFTKVVGCGGLMVRQLHLSWFPRKCDHFKPKTYHVTTVLSTARQGNALDCAPRQCHLLRDRVALNVGLTLIARNCVCFASNPASNYRPHSLQFFFVLFLTLP